MTEELLARIKSGEASTQDLKAAIDWLIKMTLQVLPYEGNPLINWLTLCQPLTLKWYNRGYMAKRLVTGRKSMLQ